MWFKTWWTHYRTWWRARPRLFQGVVLALMIGMIFYWAVIWFAPRAIVGCTNLIVFWIFLFVAAAAA